jgi:CRISPR/Cas system-associated protein endoribonuclease Cas2
METAVIKYLGETFDLAMPSHSTRDQLETFLAEKINDMILNDFSSLVQILYRIDVSEVKIKNLLRENPGSNAGRILAALIIERQLQKITSKRQSRTADNNKIDENESWDV